MKDFLNIKELFGYWFRKRDHNRPTNESIKAMHWTNRISMFMFLVCLVVIIYRSLTR